MINVSDYNSLVVKLDHPFVVVDVSYVTGNGNSGDTRSSYQHTSKLRVFEPQVDKCDSNYEEMHIARQVPTLDHALKQNHKALQL